MMQFVTEPGYKESEPLKPDKNVKQRGGGTSWKMRGFFFLQISY